MIKSRLLGAVYAVLLTAIPFSTVHAITVQVEFSGDFTDNTGDFATPGVISPVGLISGLFRYEATAIDAAPSSSAVDYVDLEIFGFAYTTDNFITDYLAGLMEFCAGEPLQGACGIGPRLDRFAIKWDWDGGTPRLLDMKYSVASINDYWILDLDTADYSLSITAVPVPAAVWLFGSGLLGLAGIARRKQTA